MVASAIRAGDGYVEVTMRDKKLAQGLTAAQAKLERFGRITMGVGEQLLKIGGTIAVPFAVAAKVFTGFSDQMQAVRAVTGATHEDFQRLNETARELGRTTSFSARQVAEGMTALGRAGLTANAILQATDDVMNLSRATMTDLAETADIASNTMNQFGLSAADMTHIADVLTATANGSAQTLTDLGESMKYVGRIAADSGASLDDTAAALAVLANNGVRGSMAGTALARAYKNFAQGPIQKHLDELGVKVADANGDFRSMVDILADLDAATANMGSVERLSHFETLFGRASVAASALASSTAKLRGGLGDVTGEAERQAKIMDAGIGGAWRRLVSAAEGIANKLGETLAPELSRMAAWLTETAGRVTAWIAANKELVVGVARLTVKVIAIGASLVALSATLKTIALAFGAAKLASIAFGKSLAILAAHPALLVAGFVALSYAMSRFRAQAVELNGEMARHTRLADLQRASHAKGLKQLEILSWNHRLNNEEMATAEAIIAKLTAAYGSLGITVDQATRTVEGFTEGQKKVRQAMQQQALEDVNAQIQETRDNLDRVQEALQRAADKTKNLFFAFGTTMFGSKDEVVAQMQELERQADMLAQKLKEQVSRRGELLEQGKRQIQQEKEAAAARQAAADPMMIADISDARALTGDAELGIADDMSRVQAEMIADAEKRELKLAEIEHNRRIRRAEATGESLIAIEELYQARIAEIQGRYAKEREAREKREAEARARAQGDLAYEVARLEIQAAKDGLEERLALIELERERELAEAAKAGLGTEDAINRKHDLRAKLARQAAGGQRALEETRAVFSGYAAGRMGGGARWAEKTAKASDNIDRNTAALLAAWQRIGGKVRAG